MSEQRRIDDKDLKKVTGGADSLQQNPPDHSGGGSSLSGEGETGSPNVPEEPEDQTGGGSVFGR
jgi:hypothetical protein